MKSVLVANRKGGCGKTVTALTLAAALAAAGGRVALADADGQKSALRWLKARPPGAAGIEALDWTAARDFGSHPKGLDWLVIDAPGALTGEAAEAFIAEAGAVVTPVMPSVFDEGSTKRFLKEIEDVKRVRKGKVALHLVANRVKPQARTAAALAAFFERIGQAPVATILERAAYADLAAKGLSVFDSPRKADVALRAQWMPLVDRLARP